MYKLSSSLVFVLFLFSAFSGQAQAIKGFKLLEKKKTAKAEIAFERAFSRPYEAPLAHLGLFKIQEKKLRETLSFQDLRRTYAHLAQAQEEFKATPEKMLKKFERKSIDKKDFQSSLDRVQIWALDAVAKSDSILLLDTFKLELGQSLSRKMAKDCQVLEAKLLKSNYYFRDYATLRSIYLNHFAAAIKQKLSLDNNYRYRTMLAYLREFPLYQVDGFCQDFPDHWLCQDCYFDAFLAAAQSKKLKALIAFIHEKPLANLDEIIAYALNQPINQYLAVQNAELESEDIHRLEELKQAGLWMHGNFPAGISDEALVELIKTYLGSAAPSNRAYRTLVAGLAQLTEKQNWPLAAALTRFAEPLFPEQADSVCIQPFNIINKKPVWFAKTIFALERENEVSQQKMLQELSSQVDECAPVINLEAKLMYFASNKNAGEENGFDVMVSIKKDSLWGKPSPIPALSGKGDQIPLALAEDGQMMLLSVNNRLYFSARTGDEKTWTVPTQVSLAVNDFPWVGKGTLAENGRVLIFEASQDSFPLLVDADINLYITLFNPGSRSWSNPAPLNITLNTPWQERTPYLHVDGESLYFTSVGHYGFAEQDLFKTTRLDNTWGNWSIPQSLGKHLNTFRDDFTQGISMPANGNIAYTTKSKGENLSTEDNIWSFGLPSYAQPKRVKVIKGQLPKRNQQPWVKLIDASSKKVLDSMRVRPSGEYSLLAKAGQAQKVIIFVDDPEFYSTAVELDIDTFPVVGWLKENPQISSISELISKELAVPTRSLFFDPLSADPSPKAQKELDWMVYFFKRRKLSFLVAGHAYAEGDAAKSKQLSLKRTENIKAYLSKNGLPKDRIWLQDFGDTKPLEVSTNPLAQAKNRRVEIYLKN